MTEAEAVFTWLTRHDFEGIDPYDGLTSPWISRTALGRSRRARLAWIQFFKRSPVNLRPLFGIRPCCNPKTLGLVLTGLSHRGVIIGASQAHTLGVRLVSRLRELRARGSTGWGYPFPWQNRHFYAPAGTPNAICSLFAVNGLLDYADATEDADAKNLAAESTRFFLDELPRTNVRDGIVFRYTPVDSVLVHNVNILVGGTLARLVTADLAPACVLDIALRAARASIAAQRRDGSWPYGEGPNQHWVDSFHTGYNLIGLAQVQAATGDRGVATSRRRGYEFFRDRLVDPDGAVRYYDRSRFPLDTHAAAQAIVTFLDSRDIDAEAVARCERVRRIMLQLLRKGDGEYVYQRWRGWTNRIVYARWTQAWVFRALAQLEAVKTIPSVRASAAAVEA